MNKNTKMLLTVGGVALFGYLIYRQYRNEQMKNFTTGKLGYRPRTCSCQNLPPSGKIVCSPDGCKCYDRDCTSCICGTGDPIIVPNTNVKNIKI